MLLLHYNTLWICARICYDILECASRSRPQVQAVYFWRIVCLICGVLTCQLNGLLCTHALGLTWFYTAVVSETPEKEWEDFKLCLHSHKCVVLVCGGICEEHQNSRSEFFPPTMMICNSSDAVWCLEPNIFISPPVYIYILHMLRPLSL